MFLSLIFKLPSLVIRVPASTPVTMRLLVRLPFTSASHYHAMTVHLLNVHSPSNAPMIAMVAVADELFSKPAALKSLTVKVGS